MQLRLSRLPGDDKTKTTSKCTFRTPFGNKTGLTPGNVDGILKLRINSDIKKIRTTDTVTCQIVQAFDHSAIYLMSLKQLKANLQKQNKTGVTRQKKLI